VIQKAGPTPDAGFFALITAFVDENVVEINEPIATEVPFPAAIVQPEITCFHLADVVPAFTRVSLLKSSTSESKAFSLETDALCLLLGTLGIMQLYLL
jgi:hypothetical protein